MALISDAEYLIHNLRLTYLRHVDDPFGSRIITVNPNYGSNAYIVASGLADIDKWPELNTAQARSLEEEDLSNWHLQSTSRETHSAAGYPAANGLKYARTIRPNTQESTNIRSRRYRAQSQKLNEHPLPPIPADAHSPTQRNRSDSAPDPLTNGSDPQNSPKSILLSDKRRSIGDIFTAVSGPSIEPPQPPVPFKPPFARAAEMEKQRKARMRRRARQAKMDAGLPLSPSDEESSSDSDSLSRDSDFEEQDGTLDPQAIASSSEDEMAALSAGSIAAAPELHIPGFSSPPQDSGQPNLSISSELDGRSATARSHTESSQVEGNSTAGSQSQAKSKLKTELFFARVKPRVPATQSLLTSLLEAQSSSPDNPFSELYASVAARGQDTYTLSVYFPHSKTPHKPIELTTQRDASVEEVIGFALWNYWEERWKPDLDADCGDDEEKKKLRLSAVSWNLKIAEDDGEVDEDFPSLDRAKKISTFNFDAYAVTLETSAAQISKNAEHDGKLVRRPSRIRVQRRANIEVPSSNINPPTSEILTSAPNRELTLGQFPSLSPSSYQGPPLFLRVRMADARDTGHIGTTIPVSAGMYMAEALSMVCRKRGLNNPKEWALMLKDPCIPIPLDRTVASLQGKSDLLLIKRSDHPIFDQYEKRVGRTTDPNASILKRQSEIPQEQYSEDFTAAYKKYNVIRKLPVLGHNDRVLAIDGDYIHIMPAGPKGGFLDSTKTSSYHAKNVLYCSQSGDPVAFKLVVRKEGTRKRYDFEAENAKQAEEIVRTIRNLHKMFKMDRGSTIKARRSRHIAT